MRVVIKAFSLCMAVLVVGALAAGCGGGDDEPTVTTSSLGKAEYVKRVAAICAKGKQKGLAAVVAYSEKTPGAAKGGDEYGQAYKVVLMPRIQTQIDEIRALGAPKGGEEEVEALLAALQDAVDAGEEDPTPTTPEFEEVLKPSAKLAEAYGVPDCAYT